MARRYLAEIRLADGDWEGAREALGRAARRRGVERRAPVPLVGWRVLGPFERRGRRGSITHAYAPEEEDLDFERSYRGDGRICRWKRVQGPRVDYREALRVEGEAVAYGYCEFAARRAGWIRLGFGSADGIKAWINDDPVLENPGRRDIREDDDLVWAWVPRGVSRLLVKVESDGGAFRSYVQAYDEIRVPPSAFLDAAIEGRELLDDERWEDARRALLEAETLEPGHPEVALGLAQADLGAGNPIGARAWAARALRERPGMVRALAVYAETQAELGETLRAFDALRAAFRASDYESEAVWRLWIETAREHRAPVQVGLALLDRARGLRDQGRQEAAADLLEDAVPRLEGSFVGHAELRDWHRGAGELAASVDEGIAALAALPAAEAARSISAEWVLELERDARRARPGDHATHARLIAWVERLWPGHPELVDRLLDRLDGAPSTEVPGLLRRVEAAIRADVRKPTWKRYSEWLHENGRHERAAAICSEGLERGIESRELRWWQARSLVALGRLDEAEALFRGLLEEPGYVGRAESGLELVRRRREAGAKGDRDGG